MPADSDVANLDLAPAFHASEIMQCLRDELSPPAVERLGSSFIKLSSSVTRDQLLSSRRQRRYCASAARQAVGSLWDREHLPSPRGEMAGRESPADWTGRVQAVRGRQGRFDSLNGRFLGLKTTTFDGASRSIAPAWDEQDPDSLIMRHWESEVKIRMIGPGGAD